MGAFVLKEGGSREEEKCPRTGKPPQRQEKGEAPEPQRAMQKQGLRRQNTEKAVLFS